MMGQPSALPSLSNQFLPKYPHRHTKNKMTQISERSVAYLVSGHTKFSTSVATEISGGAPDFEKRGARTCSIRVTWEFDGNAGSPLPTQTCSSRCSRDGLGVCSILIRCLLGFDNHNLQASQLNTFQEGFLIENHTIVPSYSCIILCNALRVSVYMVFRLTEHR